MQDNATILAMPSVQKVIQIINEGNCETTDEFYNVFNSNICTLSTGATKVVFMNKAWDFVIKCGLSCIDNDYCAIEAQNYQQAVEKRVERILLETRYLTSVHGFSLYVQPRYDTTMDKLSEHDYNTLCRKCNNFEQKRFWSQSLKGGTKKAFIGMYAHHRISEIWWARVVQLYGKRFARSLEEWAHENKVNDLHASNVGFVNKKPIILDYAGYHERSW